MAGGKPRPDSWFISTAYVSFIICWLNLTLISTIINPDKKPTSYTTAMKSRQSRSTINLEFDALLNNNTWIRVPPTRGMNVDGCKWVF
jgi:hypothetical protein